MSNADDLSKEHARSGARDHDRVLLDGVAPPSHAKPSQVQAQRCTRRSRSAPSELNEYVSDKNEQPRLCSGVVVVYIKQQLETFIHCYQQTIPRFRVRTRMS
jgi:hypothetical protein